MLPGFDQILPVVLIAISSNIDNIGVGTSYGIRKIHIPTASNALIAVVTAVSTYLSMFFGQRIYLLLSQRMDDLIGGGIIIAVGLWAIGHEGFAHRDGKPRHENVAVKGARSSNGFRQMVRMLSHPLAADRELSGYIALKEALALAMGLSINNIPNGVGAGVLGLNIYAMTFMVFVVSIVTLWFGIYLGRLGGHWVRRSAGVFAGILLVCVGCYEIFV